MRLEAASVWTFIAVIAHGCASSHEPLLDGGVGRVDAGPALDAHAPVDAGALRSCEEELARVQACELDLQCGQPIAGTSCGCTRDLVARRDADLTRLESLLRAGECDLGGSTCDCPEADGFRCTDGRCAWCLVDELPGCSDGRTPRCTFSVPACACELSYHPVRIHFDAAGVPVDFEGASDGTTKQPWTPEAEACMSALFADHCYPYNGSMVIEANTGSCSL